MSLMIVLDSTIVAVALPTIQRDLAFSPAGVAWVVNGWCSALQCGGEGPCWEGRQGPSSALNRAVLLLDVLLHDAWRCTGDGACAPRLTGRFGPRPVLLAGSPCCPPVRHRVTPAPCPG